MLRTAFRIPLALVLLAVSLAAASGARAENPGDSAASDGLELLPRDELFAPLIADPNWPRFAAAHEWRLGTDEFDRAAQVSFGESVAFVRGALRDGASWEVGLQAQVDALFDLTTRSLDLANEDYFVGVTGTWSVGDLATQLRVAHVSSHLGDEYLLRVGGGRESVSYETVDLLVSWTANEAFRVYGGGGVYVSPSPDYDPVFFQVGGEWRAGAGLFADRLRPIAGLDLQVRQESDWVPDVAALVGLRLSKSREDEVRHIDFFFRAYHGRSPEGQFFRQDVGLLGLGLRLGL